VQLIRERIRSYVVSGALPLSELRKVKSQVKAPSVLEKEIYVCGEALPSSAEERRMPRAETPSVLVADVEEEGRSVGIRKLTDSTPFST